ncbi:hypothetical protein MASR1M50_26970 [Burkholderiales bacterium]
MANTPHPVVEHIRTLALVGPTAAGKTLLAEALLHASGAIGAMGSVERGSTVSDHDPQEIKAQHSLQSSVMHLQHDGCRVHLIDTPGLPDFIGQSLPALEAVETCAIVINAAAGIEPMARRMMEYAAERQQDRLIIVNKIDAEGADLPALLADIQASFGSECLPLNLPDAGATQVVDCFYQRDGHSDFGAVADAHRALVEQVVEVDGDFVERYLNEGDVDASELHAPLEQALREGHLIPVCFVSARSGAGVAELLDIISKLLPNPTEGNPPDFFNGEGADAQLMHATPDPAAHVLAQVFKISIDPYVGTPRPTCACTRAPSRPPRSSSSATAASPSRSATCSCSRARTTSKWPAPGRATSAPSARSTNCTTTPCCTTPPRTRTSTCSPCPSRCRCTASPLRPRQARRRAAPVGNRRQAGGRGPVPEDRARGQHQRDRRLRPGRAAPAGAAGAPA